MGLHENDKDLATAIGFTIAADDDDLARDQLGILVDTQGKRAAMILSLHFGALGVSERPVAFPQIARTMRLPTSHVKRIFNEVIVNLREAVQKGKEATSER